ncbi:MAG TPA: DUF432 domain-containing protein [Candidatus Nitrosotalea sp.]|nr:DUF432 domain-containing protein [Candidatus Nitrosotalea sp.]
MVSISESPDTKFSINNTDNFEYGVHTINEKIEFHLPHNSITIERVSNDKFRYKRTTINGIVEKIIAVRTENLEMEFVPTHPLYTPSFKTDFMFLRLMQPIFVSRNSVTDIFVSIPIEIGLFFTGNDIREPFDVFSCEPSYSRYALYGDPDQGTLCKYAKVMIQTQEERCNQYIHGGLKITIDNELDTGISLGKIVFPIQDHDIYYNRVEADYDDLKINVKDRLGIEIVDIVQQNETGPKEWSKSPRLKKSTDIKFAMENGFD